MLRVSVGLNTTLYSPNIGVLMFALALWLPSAPSHAGEIQPPQVASQSSVNFPLWALPPKQDHVLLEFSIGTDGRVFDVVVLESAGEPWDIAAKDALLKWRFVPAKHEGIDVVSRTQLSFLMPGARDAGVLVVGVDAGTNTQVPDASQSDADGGVTAAAAQSNNSLTQPFFDPDAGHAEHEFSSTVTARAQPRSRGASDFQIEVGQLKVVPRSSGAEFLKLAPGVLLTNEGGEGHPDRIFLRGFDAKEGQDLEISTDGVPVNDLGNLHGNGYADLNFIIPELVESVRVIEGPFDPRQGNFAVAGSADYELGLQQRGITVKATAGTFNTQRLTLLWGPSQQTSKTFAGVQVFRSDGFGQNRGAQSGKALGQVEIQMNDNTTVRLASAIAALQFRSAGVLRQDDLAQGRVGFYDSYDNRQGGDSLRGSLSAEVHYHAGGLTHQHQLFGLLRSSRLLENFTGFVTDTQLAQQTPHGQRGDLLDRDVESNTVGARGYGRLRGRWQGRTHELEAGYFARVDFVSGQQQRLLGPDSTVPYTKEIDLRSRLSDVGAYVDVNVSPFSWLTLRAGVRTEILSFSIQNNCAAQEVRRPSMTNPPLDQSCLSQRDFGLYREPTERVSATGAALLPRGTVLFGPFKSLTLSASFGDGIRSIDPQFVNDGRSTPFASIRAWEAGAAYANRNIRDWLDLSARAVLFGTRVDKDQIFNEQAGRNIVGGSTTRLGGLIQGRLRGSFFDVASHVTVVQSKFDDSNTLVPYVPDAVVRMDASLFHDAWFSIAGTRPRGSLGLGVTFVGRRPLPFGQRSDSIFTTDLNAEVAWRFVTMSVSSTNLFNAQYRLAEFNYTSDFRPAGAFPTLVPVRHFTAGSPRQVFFTLSFNVGGT